MRGRLDAWLAVRVEGGLGRLDPEVLDILRLGLYQLTELDRVPPHAAVDESVRAARAAAGPGAAGLVNAVLRRVAREGVSREEFPDPVADPIGWGTTWGSHPEWLVTRWVDRWGAEEARALIESNNRRPPVCLTPLGVDADECIRRLAERGVPAARAPVARDSVEIEPADLEVALAAVPCVVQDPAAALVAEYADLPPEAEVADLCAAPGGKTLQWAAAGRRVIAVDRSRARLRRVQENRARVPGVRVSLLCADAARPPLRPVRAVVVDAPCTGTGTLRRHPDARWRLGPSDLAALVELQRAILAGAAQVTARGGVLIYATCSLEPEENEDTVSAFLRAQPEFELAPPDVELPAGARTERGELRVLPQRWGTDGAFAARLRRRPGG